METARSFLFEVGTVDHCQGLFGNMPFLTTVKAAAFFCILPANRLLNTYSSVPKCLTVRLFSAWPQKLLANTISLP
jgi:hypothetical protein